jgi:hypothetical protein
VVPANGSCVYISNQGNTPLLVAPGTGTKLAGSKASKVAWNGYGAAVCYDAANANYRIVNGRLDTPLPYCNISSSMFGVQSVTVSNHFAKGFGFQVNAPGCEFSKIYYSATGARRKSALGILDSTGEVTNWWCQTSSTSACGEGKVYLAPGDYIFVTTSSGIMSAAFQMNAAPEMSIPSVVLH